MLEHIRRDFSQLGNPANSLIYTWFDLAQEDERIAFVGADSLGAYLVRDRYDPKYREWFWAKPERRRRMIMSGIQEANVGAFAGGLAQQGFKVFWQEMAWLFERAYNMIVCSICIDRYNVTLLGIAQGIGGGPTHQNLRDIALFSAIPNMIVTAPVDAVEAKEIALFAHKYIGPMYIRAAVGAWGRGVPTFFEEGYTFRLGKAPLVRDGDDVTVIGIQEWVSNAILAAEILSKEGIDVRVIDMSTIKPLDEQAIVRAAQETGAIVTAESTNIHGGLGSAVAGVVVEHNPVPMMRFALDDLFTQREVIPGKMAVHHRQTVDDLVAAIKATVKRK